MLSRVIVSVDGRMMGRVLVCRDAQRASVSTVGMAPGVYVLQLINGEDVKTQKIVIK